MRSVWTMGAVLAAGLAGAAQAQSLPPGAQPYAPLTPERAAPLFAEAQVICERDGGKLWRHSLCGPIMLVDPDTDTIVTNHADAGGVLKPANPASGGQGLFTGKIPDKMVVSNTPTDWSGTTWTQLIWPFVSPDAETRHVMLAHELFHRIQRDVPMAHPDDGQNGQMDTLEGRYLLQLEWRALAKALEAQSPAARKAAVADAILFRAERYRRFPAALTDETGLEMNEGVPEYTGVRIGLITPAEQTAYAIKDLSSHVGDDTFVRSFAYATGPAYGLLLDQADPAWLHKLKSGPALWRLLQTAMKLPAPIPTQAAVAARAKAYDDGTLRKFEVAREDARQKRAAAYRAALVDGPVLVVSTAQSNREFRPTTLVALDDTGTVYPTLRLTAPWGVLEVTGASSGALLRKAGGATVSLKDADAGGLKGVGWTLKLSPGWSVKTGPRPGDMMLTADP